MRTAPTSGSSRPRTDVDTDRMLQLALTRVLEIIGEAASRVTKDGQARYPGIPWNEAITTRDRIIQGYDTVDYDHSQGGGRPRIR